MAGELFPQHYLEDTLGLRSLFEGRAATQFNHRWLAYTIWALSALLAWRAWYTPLGRGALLLFALVSLQALWGILTLIHTAPMPLALVHQGLGVIVTLAAFRLVWLTGRRDSKTAAATA
jgi:cytochrome c oxidase assembly protein subunit 15